MTSVRLYPSGHDVATEAGDTVLAALERAGYALPNNCRAGACGECKVRVRAGRFDQGMVLDMAISAEERAAGYGLMCMAKPLEEVLEIEWGTADAQPRLFPPRQHVPFVVTDKIARTPRIVEVRLHPVEASLRFWPGQYVLLGGPDGPARPYSIANAPRPDGELTLLVSRVPGGRTSGWIHDGLAVGEPVHLDGPYGTFVGDPSVDTPVLCLAAGSGLAPILSLTEAALRRGFPHPVTLLFSARTDEDVLDRGLMAWWAARHPRFRFVHSRTGWGAAVDPRADPPVGRLPALLPELVGDLSATSVFIAGSPAFVAACVGAVRALGAAERGIHTEGFTPGAGAVPPPPERVRDR